MRRLRGNHPAPLDGRDLARKRAAATCRLRPEDVQFVPVLTSSARRAGTLRQAFGRDRIAPSHPRSRRLTLALPLLALGLRPASHPVRLVSFISELASHEVPGFGAPVLPSVLGLFLVGWQLMIVAMMLPSSLPLVRMFRAAAANQPHPPRVLAALLGGYALV